MVMYRQRKEMVVFVYALMCNGYGVSDFGKMFGQAC